MKNNFFKNLLNKWQFQNAGHLYHVEPMVSTIEYWENMIDTGNMKKAKSLKMRDLEGSALYAKLVEVHGEHYWELYIINSPKIHICYVRSRELNIIEMY